MTRGTKAIPPLVRFHRLIQHSADGCWLWAARVDKHGYGRFTVARGKFARAHRWAYEQHVGPIPDGLDLDHLCRVRRCVNPAHLEPVTRAENTRRASRLIVTCANGHDYTTANTYIRPNGQRDCRQCIRDRVRRYKQRSAA